MEAHEKRKLFFSVLYPSLFVIVLWLVAGIEHYFELDFTPYGILPRDLLGLRGIFLSPLIHGSWSHLINNSIPLFFLAWMLFYFYRSLAFRIILLSYVLAGLYTWISARTSYHIGASGLVYSLFGFLLFSGFIRKNIRLIGISFLVAFFYGSLVWGILPWDQTVSWEGHFWGLLLGLVFAFYYRKIGPQAQKYSWEYEEEEDADADSVLEAAPQEIDGMSNSKQTHNTAEKLDWKYDYKKRE